MSFKTHIICNCPHPPSTGRCCICIWFFQQLHSAIEQNKQKCLFHFPVLEKRPYFPYSLTQIRFAFYFGTTPFIANLLSGGIVDQLRPQGPKKLFLRPPPSYLRVWTPPPPLSEGLDRHCFSVFYRIPIQGRRFVQTLDCEIVPGGTPGNSCWGCAARFSKSWLYFRPHLFSDLASKIHTRFHTWRWPVTKHNNIKQKLCHHCWE